MPPELRDALANSICMNVRSFRKDGTPVDTPLWTVQVDGKIACYTDDRTFKLKRMVRNPNVWLAACDVWARRSSEYYPAVVRVASEPERRERVFAALREKYGIHWKLSLWGSLLTGRVKHRVVLEFTVEPDAKPI